MHLLAAKKWDNIFQCLMLAYCSGVQSLNLIHLPNMPVTVGVEIVHLLFTFQRYSTCIEAVGACFNFIYRLVWRDHWRRLVWRGH